MELPGRASARSPMQRPNEQKRRDILAAAERLFATRPFHEVKLDDVAASARIGKGTIYIYFKNKEDLYLTLIREGMGDLLGRLRNRIEVAEEPAIATLEMIVREMVRFAAARPNMYQLIRVVMPGTKSLAERGELARLVETVLRRGIRMGELVDPHPEITAQFLPSAIRAAMVFGPASASEELRVRHIVRVFSEGLLPRMKEKSLT
jgi:AcrR family transcriptional regulator